MDDWNFQEFQASQSMGGDWDFGAFQAQQPGSTALANEWDFGSFQEQQRQSEPMQPYDHLPEILRPQQPDITEVAVPLAPPTLEPERPLSYRPLEMNLDKARRALSQAQGVGSAESSRGYYTPGGARSIFDAEEMLTAKEQAGTESRGYTPGGNPLGDAIIKAVGDSPAWDIAMGAFDVASKLSKETIFDPTIASLKAVEDTYAKDGNMLEAFKNYQLAGAKEMLNAFRGDEPSLHQTMQRGDMVHQAASKELASGNIAPLPDPVLDTIAKAAGQKRSPEFDRQMSALAWEVGMDITNVADFIGIARATGKLGDISKVGDAAEALKMLERPISELEDATALAGGRRLIDEVEIARRAQQGEVLPVQPGEGSAPSLADLAAARNEALDAQATQVRAERAQQILDAAPVNERARTGLDLMEARAANEMEAPNIADLGSFRQWVEEQNRLKTSEELRQIRRDGAPGIEFQDDPGVAQAAQFQGAARERSPGSVNARLAEEADVQRRLAQMRGEETPVPRQLEVIERGNVRSRETFPPEPLETPPRELELNPELTAESRSSTTFASGQDTAYPVSEVAGGARRGDTMSGQMYGASTNPGGPVKLPQTRPAPSPPPSPPGRPPKQGLGAGTPAPRPQTPVQVSSEIKGVRRINRELQGTLSKLTGTRLLYGRMKGAAKTTPGRYHVNRNLVELVKGEDIDVVAHEVGHALDTHYGLMRYATGEVSAELARLGKTGEAARNQPGLEQFSNSARFSDSQIGDEISAMADPARPGSLSSYRAGEGTVRQRAEGFAEYFRTWMTDPDEAARLAPATDKAWGEFLDRQGDVGRSFRVHQADYRAYRKSSKREQFRSKISDTAPEVRTTANDVIAGTYDRFRSLEVLTELVEAGRGGRKLVPSEDPYLQARMLSGLDNVMNSFLDGGPLRFSDRQPTGTPGLKQILKDVGKDAESYRDFRDYMVARRAQELEARNIRSGFDSEGIKDALENRASKFTNEEFEKVADQVYAWQNEALQYAKDAGFLTAEQIKRIQELNKSYVPFQRIREIGAGELAVSAAGGGAKGLNAGSPGSLRRIRGSASDIVDPFETMVDNVSSVITAAERNRVGQTLLKLWDEDAPNIGQLFSEVPAPVRWQKIQAGDAVSARRLKKELESIGVDFDLMGIKESEIRHILDVMPDKFLARIDSQLPPNTVRIKDAEGNHRFIKLHESLYKAYTGMDETALKLFEHWGPKFIEATSNALRSGATVYNPFFPMFNFIRDAVNASVRSRNNPGVLKGLERAGRGLAILLGDPDTVADFARFGGKQGVEELVSSRTAHKTRLRNIVEAKSLTEQKLTWLPPAVRKGMRNAGSLMRSPFDALKAIGEASDDIIRLGEFKMTENTLRKMNPGWSAADIKRRAAFEARDLMDFGKRGNHDLVRTWRRLVPFFGSGLTGNYDTFRALAGSDIPGQALGLPGKASRQAISTAGLAITVPTLSLYFANRNNPRYWEQTQDTRDRFWLFPVNGGENFVRIPKPHLLGTLFATVPERWAAHLDKNDPQALVGLGSKILAEGTNRSSKLRIGGVEYATPAIPPVVQLAWELGVNYDGFRGKPVDIYKHYNPDAPAYTRSSEYNSLTSRELSRVLDKLGGKYAQISPPEIEHAMRSLLGGSADNILRGIDPGIGIRTPGLDDVTSALTGKEAPPAKEKEWLGFKASNNYSEAEARLAKEHSRLKSEKERAKFEKQGFSEARQLRQFNNAEKKIKRLKERIRNTRNKQEQQRMRDEIISTSRRLLKGSKFELPE